MQSHQLARVAEQETSSSAVNYSHYSEQQKKAATELVSTVFNLLDKKNNLRIYDVGCGTGALLQSLQDRSSIIHLCGSDFSAERIKVAKTNSSHIHYLKKDAQHSATFINTFDIVFATSMLHHIPQNEHAQVYTEFYKTLRAGGFLAVVTYGPNNPLDHEQKAFIEKNRLRFQLQDFQVTRTYLPFEAYKANLENAGFNILHHQEKTILLPTEINGLKHWLQGFLPAYQYINFKLKNEKLADEFLTEFVFYLAQKYPQGMPNIHLELVARKPANELQHAVAFFTRSGTKKEDIDINLSTSSYVI